MLQAEAGGRPACQLLLGQPPLTIVPPAMTVLPLTASPGARASLEIAGLGHCPSPSGCGRSYTFNRGMMSSSLAAPVSWQRSQLLHHTLESANNCAGLGCAQSGSGCRERQATPFTHSSLHP